MNLARNFDKAAGGIKMLTRFILRHRFNHRIGETFTAKVIERMFDELAPQAQSAKFSSDGEIGNAALARLAIDGRRDVTHDAISRLSYENAVRICRHVIIDVPR